MIKWEEVGKLGIWKEMVEEWGEVERMVKG